jgi:molybdate transport system permease protein
VVVLALAAVSLAFLALPLVGLLQRTEWSALWEQLSRPGTVEALRLSLVCSSSAAVLSVVLGTPLAWTLARTDLPGRGLLRGLVLLPMVLPPVVGGVALLSAFSLRSPLGGWLHDAFGVQLTFTTAGAIMAETFVAMPFYVIAVEAALRAVDRRYEEVAAQLGAGGAAVFRRVTLPTIAPSVAAGAVLAWARALGEFGATITFAGNLQGRTQTLPLAVYVALESDRDTAIALSLVLVAVSLTVLIAMRRHLWAARP